MNRQSNSLTRKQGGHYNNHEVHYNNHEHDLPLLNEILE